ncbi:pyridoxamine 5'-phosphate oxidase family protein [Kribbella sp. NPDC051770]|uniref:pyridoxamine 5'-phosphate oxidase family protein n=1 Tax=Kribbella sp. NPDC051770 TaxID=3155413 RepID=UPI00343447B8
MSVHEDTARRTAGFHEGELAVQRRAGVEYDASRLEGMLRPPLLDGGAAKFLAQREFAVITARDPDSRLWTSPLHGPAGFLEAAGTTLAVHTAPPAGDPLHLLPADQPAGLIVIEFAIRRRFRVNGTLIVSRPDLLAISADQAYGNCPQYIHPRPLPPATERQVTEMTNGLLGQELIERSDTFFLGTTHPERGADTSHKGGTVHIDGDTLWWADQPGNNMFNSLGNLTTDPTAALLFVDFATGDSLHLSGRATIDWDAPTETGRAVRFTPTRSVLTSGGS